MANNMALKHTNNEVTEMFRQNENQQRERHIVVQSANIKTYKNNSVGIKYGLSELSNDKTYLETELPARKRPKPGAESFKVSKNSNKTSTAELNDDEAANFVEEKHSGVSTNILSNEQGFKNNPSKNESSNSNLTTEIETWIKPPALTSDTSSVFQGDKLVNQLKFDSNELNKCNFENKSENCDFESNSENVLLKNIDDKISNRGTESETEFDDEINKCCKLLNLDVPKMVVNLTTDIEIANYDFGNKTINNRTDKCDIGNNNNNNNQSYLKLNSKSNKLLASVRSMSSDEDINFEAINSDKKLEMQDELLNEEKNYENYEEVENKGNSVLYTTINSFPAICNENCIDVNNKFFHDEINVGLEANSIESEFKDNHKNKVTIKINSISNDKRKSATEPNNFFSEISKTCDGKSNTEHLDLTIDNISSSNQLKFQGIISQDHLNDNNEVLSAVDDSSDILSLYAESDIDIDGTYDEISKINISENVPTILQGTSENEAVSHTSPDHDNKTNIDTANEVKKKDSFIFNEKIYAVDENHPLDDKNCELLVLDSISDNECDKSKNFHIKVDESFVSEYEISLLVDDTDSIFSEESFDSEYEVSLLEDDVNDEENNDSPENISDSDVGSFYLPNIDEKDKKILAIHSPQGYFEKQENGITENFNLSERETDKVIFKNKIHSKSISRVNIASEERIQSNCVESSQVANSGTKISVWEEEMTNQITDNINLSKIETDKVIYNSKAHLKSISDKNIVSKERILSNREKNNQIVSDTKILAQKGETKGYNVIQPTENTNHKHENDFKVLTGGEKILKLEKPTTLRNGQPDIKTKPSESTNGSHSELKLEIKNVSQTSNKVIVNSNKLENLEEKSAVLITNKHIKDSTSKDTATIEKFVKTKLDVPDTCESKQIKNNKTQTSNKVVDIKMNDTKKLEEKVLNANSNKQLTESICADKALGENTVKTELGVSAADESKQDTKDAIPDYFEEEKEDLINPGWDKIRELSTDEERYRQVRDCWKSKNIPNPFKNLTYYSYRKHKINPRENNTGQTRQHKRHASSNLNDKNAKRSRSCTYIFDDRIKSIEKEKEMETKTIHKKMWDEVERLNNQQHEEEQGLQNFYGYQFNPKRQFDLHRLEQDYQQRVSSVTAEYEYKVNYCREQYTSEINKLKSNRNEVFQFYSFYKGLNANENKDPTILTNGQIQELEEIENIYKQMDRYY